MKSIVAVLLMATACAAYKAGPPMSTCGTMMPDHNAMSQGLDSLDANFRVTTDTSCFKEGTEVTVTITNVASGVFFEGFFVQARKVGKSDNAYGTFDKALNYPREFEDNVQTIDCFNGTEVRAFDIPASVFGFVLLILLCFTRSNVNGTCFQIPKNSRPFSGKGFHVYLRISRILETGKTGKYMNKRIT
ncbi:hypothetical protein CAPTEDRAFT_195732 [Capitella teleta]|uniref:Reelin domain-containing protein n=1 Tax=Capitella teleta TaxID=283909 RepID=R7T511_CAPTE|nr:hypothetical protein CAPTEDRAFT_195732 [Capitella teleta]|eukprot:ELT88237.1 hypothetical protein CAPTEDRAFT_195732 [Capitella teleta]